MHQIFFVWEKKNYSRLKSISGLNLEQVHEAEFQICKDIFFISEGQIKQSTWKISEKLVADIDPKDVHYIAFSKHFRCKIWSGNKVLMRGLKNKDFTNFITTEDLYRFLENHIHKK